MVLLLFHKITNYVFIATYRRRTTCLKYLPSFRATTFFHDIAIRGFATCMPPMSCNTVMMSYKYKNN